MSFGSKQRWKQDGLVGPFGTRAVGKCCTKEKPLAVTVVSCCVSVACVAAVGTCESLD